MFKKMLNGGLGTEQMLAVLGEMVSLVTAARANVSANGSDRQENTSRR
jgi:hypothetical protein